jgi:3-hydroxybutyryl-CoA dehydrogenase
MSVKAVMVVGAGASGSGIAEVCAQHEIRVLLVDVKDEQLRRAKENISRSLTVYSKTGKLHGSVDEVMSRIRYSADLHDGADVQATVEAVYEEQEIKQHVFAEIDASVRDPLFMASNASAIPITYLGSATKRPDRVVGIHFFNPVPKMPVVEVVKGLDTTPETLAAAMQFARAIGKRPIPVRQDLPGFALNRINLVSNVEAIRLVEKGVATAEDIDTGTRLAFGRKMGPFETMDLVGLDVMLSALSALYHEEQDVRFMPPSLLLRMVAAGHLGRKTGQGWYSYKPDGTKGAT